MESLKYVAVWVFMMVLMYYLHDYLPMKLLSKRNTNATIDQIEEELYEKESFSRKEVHDMLKRIKKA